MSNLLKCPRCYQNFIAEEYREHSCPIRVKSVKTVGVLQDYGIITNRNGDEVRLVKTVDGIILRLVFCEHLIPHNLFQQPIGNRKKTTEDETEPEIMPGENRNLV